MAIDTSMYRNMQAPDIMGNYAQGLNMRAMIDQRDREKNTDQAFAAGITKNPDGTVTYDGQKTLGKFAELGLGKEAAEYSQTLKTQGLAEQKAQMEKQMQEVDLIGRAALSVTDQTSYDNALASLQQQKIDVSQMPKAYDPNLVKSYAARALSAKDQLEQQWKGKEFGLKEREVRAKEIESQGKKVEGMSKAAMELRKERSSLQTTKDTQAVSAAYNKVQSAAAKPTAAGDLSMIFNYMKMLDPGSVVREGEFATAQNATGVPGRVTNLYNQILQGNRLNPDQRADFVEQAGGLYKAQTDIQKQVDSQFAEVARKSGVDPQDVLLNFEANKPTAASPKTVIQNGITYTLNEKTGKYE